MSFLITSQLVEARQQCPRKAFFFLKGSPEPHLHDYPLPKLNRNPGENWYR